LYACPNIKMYRTVILCVFIWAWQVVSSLKRKRKKKKKKKKKKVLRRIFGPKRQEMKRMEKII